MQKIPTCFERDWEGNRSRVLPVPVAECAWVFAGEGVATRKYDGTCCLIQDGRLFRRESLRDGRPEPEGFLFVEYQPGEEGQPAKRIGWVPVGEERRDRWHREALETLRAQLPELPDGTYELLGPKVNGNPERFDSHVLLRHQDAEGYIVPRTFEGMRDLLAALDVEGFVFHHPDGRMAKIKGKDFGLRRGERLAAV